MKNECRATQFLAKIRQKLDTPPVKNFFMGKGYPLFTVILVFLGHTFGIEVYLFMLNVLFFGASMLVCDSIRPMITILCTFMYQVPLLHTPGGPVESDYYLTGAPFVILVISAIAVLSILVYIFVKFKVLSGLSFRKTPLLISTLVLSGAFLLNGAFSSTWQAGDLAYGVVQAIMFPLCFYLFYKGLRAEKDVAELGRYVSYVAALMGLLLAFEMAELYIFGNDFYGTLFDSSGAVIKDRIHLGFATWNPVGVTIAVLIPAIFYGVLVGKYPWLYFAAATVTYLAALSTFSRNAMIVSTLAYAACVIIACFVGDKKRKLVFRIVALAGCAAVLFVVIAFWDKIAVLARDLLERGLSDNGRFRLWNIAIENFKSHPVFGTGFYHFTSPDLFNYSPAIPLMAHQTFLQLMSSMGFVGLAAYIYYRVDTLEMFFKKPTLMKTMLGLSALVLLLESLADNFIFTVFPLFFYSIALAVAAITYERQLEEENPASPARSGLDRKRRKGRKK